MRCNFFHHHQYITITKMLRRDRQENNIASGCWLHVASLQLTKASSLRKNLLSVYRQQTNRFREQFSLTKQNALLQYVGTSYSQLHACGIEAIEEASSMFYYKLFLTSYYYYYYTSVTSVWYPTCDLESVRQCLSELIFLVIREAMPLEVISSCF